MIFFEYSTESVLVLSDHLCHSTNCHEYDCFLHSFFWWCFLSLKPSFFYRHYSVKGTYRRIVAKAEKLDWKIIHYNDPQVDFIASDLDEMNGKKIVQDEAGN